MDNLSEDNSGVKIDIKNTYNTTIENNKILDQTTETGFDANISQTQFDIEEFLKDEEEEILMREKLKLEKQSVKLFRIYAHFLEPKDWVFLILAIIGKVLLFLLYFIYAPISLHQKVIHLKLGI